MCMRGQACDQVKESDVPILREAVSNHDRWIKIGLRKTRRSRWESLYSI